jgi:hypothetical protein
MSSPSEIQQAYTRFMLEEAQWLDSEIRKFLPNLLIVVVSFLDRAPGLRWLGGLCHFLVDYVVISAILKIKITRNEDRSWLTGKGYRAGKTQIRLDRVRTKIHKSGVEIAERAFPIGVIIG